MVFNFTEKKVSLFIFALKTFFSKNQERRNYYSFIDFKDSNEGQNVLEYCLHSKSILQNTVNMFCSLILGVSYCTSNVKFCF